MSIDNRSSYVPGAEGLDRPGPEPLVAGDVRPRAVLRCLNQGVLTVDTSYVEAICARFLSEYTKSFLLLGQGGDFLVR